MWLTKVLLIVFGDYPIYQNHYLEYLTMSFYNFCTIFLRICTRLTFNDIGYCKHVTLNTGLPLVLMVIYVFLLTLLANWFVKKKYTKKILFVFLIFFTAGWLFIFSSFISVNLEVNTFHWEKYLQNTVKAINQFQLQANAFIFFENKPSNVNKNFNAAISLSFLWLFYALVYYKPEPFLGVKKQYVKVSAWKLLLLLLCFWMLVINSYLYIIIFSYINYIIVFDLSALVKSKNTAKVRFYFFYNNRIYVACTVLTWVCLFFIDFAGYIQIPVYYLYNILSISLMIWFICILWTINCIRYEESSYIMPIIWGVYVPLIVIISFFGFLPQIPSLSTVLIIFIYFIFFEIKYKGRSLAILPSTATERERKYLMFTKAKKAVNKERLFGLKNFNDQTFYVFSRYITISWLMFLAIVSTPTYSFNFFTYVIIGMLGISPWYNYFASWQLIDETKGKGVLDWRGILLARVELHFVSKYNLCIIMVTCILQFLLIMLSFFNPGEIYSHKLIYFFMLLLVLFIYLISAERLITMWLKTQTSIQESTYEYWTDVFWKQMSPALRDYLYWRPIPSSNFEMLRLPYGGFRFLFSTKLFLNFFFGGVCFSFLKYCESFINIQSNFFFFLIILLWLFCLIWSICRLYRPLPHTDRDAIYGYVHLMFWVQFCWTIIYSVIWWCIFI